MAELLIGSIAFNAPWAIDEQIRLFRKWVRDDHELLIFDNSTENAQYIEGVCRESGTRYIRLKSADHEHPGALSYAAEFMLAEGTPYIGFVDHDLWPAEETEIIPILKSHGFLGIGQRHGPTGRLYPWPGCLFLSCEWLNGREMDFGGIRGVEKREDGDCGSNLWPLFSEEDWSKLFLVKHGYEHIRAPDGYGLQSSGFEYIHTFIHATNVSNWMLVPDPGERERMLREIVAAL